MENDDQMRGRILSRREVLQRFGAAGAAAIFGGAAVIGCHSGSSSDGTTTSSSGGTSTSSTSTTSTTSTSGTATGGISVVATPELTEGPYFVDELLNRADLVSGTARAAVTDGQPLALTLGVYSLASGVATPIVSAMVDLWHADAIGTYSDIASEGTSGETWLRGYQLTDAAGQVSFATIYPGWYQGRTIHLHFKVRLFDAAGAQSKELTSQLFFDDSFSDGVMALSPYSGRGARGTRNANDGIYGAVGGQLQLVVAPAANGVGYAASTFNVGLV